MPAKHHYSKWERYSYEGLGSDLSQDNQGRIFMSGHTTGVDIRDMSEMTIVHAGVDSIRQLYHGKIKASWLPFMQEETPNEITLMGVTFAVGKMGKNSGYRLRFQNNEIGIIILLGSYYRHLDQEGAHLKIELSPQFIAQSSRDGVQSWLESISGHLLERYKPAGCAVHLAVDFQGAEIPKDLQERFVTRCRYKSIYSGIQDFDIPSNSVSYGNHESYLFGKAASLQTSVYRKDLEIIVRDKVDYWQDVWTNYSLGLYNPDQPVWRVEMRLHHTCVRELGGSMGKELETWQQVYEYLTDLWRYAMNNNRLMVDKKRLDPLWQLLTDDVDMYLPAKGFNLFRKKKSDISAVTRNIGLFLGNFITLMARKRADAAMIYVSIKKMYIWEDVRRYWLSKGGLGAFRSWIDDMLQERLLRGKAA